MENKPPPRTRWITIRMTEGEHQAAECLRKATTCNSLSEYARKAALGKPVILRTHNQSLDDFVREMDQLQKELKRISTNFNQLVHRLQTLKQVRDIQQWILLNEQEKTRLLRQIDTISETIQKAYQLWLRA